MNKPTYPVAALALFDRSGQEAIIHYIKSNPGSVILSDLNRNQNPLLPPGIFSIAGPEQCGDSENGYRIILALSMMMAGAMKDVNLSAENYWPQLIVKVFGVDEKYAEKLASNIDTVDDATGLGNLRWLSSYLNFLPGVSIDANSVADDVDAPFEILQAGEVFEKLLVRAMLSTNRANAMIRPDLPTAVRNIMEAARSVQEGGDVYADARLGDLLAPYIPLPIPASETGGIFQDIGNFGKKVLGTIGNLIHNVSDPKVAGALGKIPLLGGLLEGGLNAVHGVTSTLLPSAQAAAAQAAQSPAVQQASPSAQATPAPALTAAEVASRTGGHIRVEMN
jgi:hypothetical protein